MVNLPLKCSDLISHIWILPCMRMDVNVLFYVRISYSTFIYQDVTSRLKNLRVKVT